jgi:hypothetical protein
MKKLLSGVVGGAGVFWPGLVHASDIEVKAAFLLQGGIGGILIGAGLYAVFMLLAAVLFKRRIHAGIAFALATAFFIYIEYKSLYFLAIATGFMRTRQMRYEFGELTTVLYWVVVGIGVWGVAVVGIALRIRVRRHRNTTTDWASEE